MSYTIAYQKVAIEEYELAIALYAERSEQAAENLIIAIKEKLDVLRTEPDRYRKTYRQFREVALKKYPYSIVYFINEVDQMVIITSIYHHKRSPLNKYKKK